MKSVLVVALLFMLLGLHGALACSEVSSSGLKFCFKDLPSSNFNNHNSSLTNILTIFDSVFSATWPSVESAVATAAAKHGFSVCQDCLTALKHMTCSAYVPGCQFGACLVNVSSQLVSAYYTCAGVSPSDAAACGRDGLGSAACNRFLAQIYQSAGNSYELAACMSRKQAEILNNNACFRAQIMGRAMCESFVDVCLCTPDQTVKDDICQYFPAEGYDIDLPAGLTCEATKGWCGAANKKRAVGDNQANQACPNDHLCLSVPQSNNYPAYGASVQTSAAAAPTSFLLAAISALFF
ncbi:uncharacterized protein ACA1_251770 [Acanthamoeba castellanii str. Neff]|uniref:Uncharacterized protein n=1 Tax=Acanthamoeba castellanii (strain ATCC 30010 / Neff) TaxID=1257118 RepID=L8HC17_ACACF|nr:uncharacterized protein ACA1_251770 [Acanthamoeba castellanii str. Neff]ELR22283.1 hypothetical protein ACA1_251770 [Acanthamoeba castellanii str. Neff]